MRRPWLPRCILTSSHTIGQFLLRFHHHLDHVHRYRYWHVFYTLYVVMYFGSSFPRPDASRSTLCGVELGCAITCMRCPINTLSNHWCSNASTFPYILSLLALQAVHIRYSTTCLLLVTVTIVSGLANLGVSLQIHLDSTNHIWKSSSSWIQMCEEGRYSRAGESCSS